jgi:hypothetical protein
LANGSTAREGTRGAGITAATAAIGAGGLARRAGVDLAVEKWSGGQQRELAAEEVLGVEKRQKSDGEEEDIESFGRHCLKRLLMQFEQVPFEFSCSV